MCNRQPRPCKAATNESPNKQSTPDTHNFLGSGTASRLPNKINEAGDSYELIMQIGKEKTADFVPMPPLLVGASSRRKTDSLPNGFTR